MEMLNVNETYRISNLNGKIIIFTFHSILYFRKDMEINSTNGKLEDEQTLASTLQKKIKEQNVSTVLRVFTHQFNL